MDKQCNQQQTHAGKTQVKTAKKFSLVPSLMAVLITGASMASYAAPPAIHAVTLNGIQVDSGRGSGVGLSRSGRYILHTGTDAMYAFDLKTQERGAALPKPGSFADAYAISPNGRYVSYALYGAGGNVYDRVTAAFYSQPVTDVNRAISDNGYSASHDQKNNTGFILLNLKTQTSVPIPNIPRVGSSIDRHDWFSADGKTILLETMDTSGNSNGYQIYNADNPEGKKLIPFQPFRANGVPVQIRTSGENRTGGSSTIALSSNGKFVAFTAPTNSSEQNIWISTLSPTGNHGLQQFNLINLNVSVDDGISVSSNGRFVSFRGQLRPGHSEYAAAQSLGHTSFYRIFRYDTLLNQVVTVSLAKDGGPIRNRRFSAAGVAAIFPATVISDDGSIIEFSSDADNLTSTQISTTDYKKYYAYISNGFNRNYQFVDMPNSDSHFKPFAPMTLIGNNQWEGTLIFDGEGPESFHFDVGGNLSGNTPVATPDDNINFGAGATQGQATSNGGNIPVTGGAGTYKVTFNDQTLQYSVTQLTSTGDWKRTVVFMYGETQTGQDMFIRGGLDHAKAKAVMGRDCDANPALCSIPIRHLNKLNPTTAPWKLGDSKLDWQGIEAGQGSGAQGSPLDWTTNFWPSSWGAKKTRDVNGYGETLINQWGQHYWMLEVDMDCSKTYNGWFELKSFISNGPGWEGNIAQAGGPWASNNHFAQCGKINVFKRGQSAPVVVSGTL